jgi:hypothetical protein
VRSSDGSAGSTVDGEPGIESAYGRILTLLNAVFCRDCVPVQSVADLLVLLMGLPTLAELKQMFCLDLEQAALDGGGAT